MTKPIRPEDIAKTQKETFPPEVFAAFNELIAENYRFRFGRIWLACRRSAC